MRSTSADRLPVATVAGRISTCARSIIILRPGKTSVCASISHRVHYVGPVVMPDGQLVHHGWSIGQDDRAWWALVVSTRTSG